MLKNKIIVNDEKFSQNTQHVPKARAKNREMKANGVKAALGVKSERASKKKSSRADAALEDDCAAGYLTPPPPPRVQLVADLRARATDSEVVNFDRGGETELFIP